MDGTQSIQKSKGVGVKVGVRTVGFSGRGRRIAICLVILWCGVVAFAAPSALVLAGGGAKGAYQVGVWKAMVELGIAKDVVVISGTSVGGINAALFASVRDPKKIEPVWLDSMGDVMVVNKSKVHDVLQEGVNDFGASVDSHNKFIKGEKEWEAQRSGVAVENLPVDKVKEIEKRANRKLLIETSLQILGRMGQRAKRVMVDEQEVDGYVDPNKLKELIETKLPREWPVEAPVVYVTAVEKGAWKRREFQLNDEPFSRKVALLRATSAIPGVFSTVEIDGKNYYDGGWTDKGGDNVPGEPVLRHHPEICTVYVVYLNDEKHIGDDREDPAKYAGKRLVEIIPSKSLHGSFGAMNFKATVAHELIALGYADAMNVLKGYADSKARRIP